MIGLQILEAAQQVIKQIDGGNPSNETGWRDDELLSAWLYLDLVITNYGARVTAQKTAANSARA